MSFLTEMIYPLYIATEAEDITGQVEASASDAIGGDSNGGEIDLNTDDILGTKEPDNNTSDESESEDGEENPDNTNLDGGMDDNQKGQDDGSMDLDNPPEEDPIEEKEDEFESTRKQKLWKKFRYLYDILMDAIELITKYIPNTSDATTIKAMNDIKDNLINAKSKAFDTMTSDYRKISYPQMQKRYSSICMIYDLITDELEKYFEIRKETSKK